LILALSACPPPPPPDKPLVFGVELAVHKDCKIHLEMMFPEVGQKFKTLTKEQFRKHAKTIMYHEYKLVKIVVDGMEIKEMFFRLPRPSEYKLEESAPKRDIVRVSTTKP
jgi:hypothetical protein